MISDRKGYKEFRVDLDMMVRKDRKVIRARKNQEVPRVTRETKGTPDHKDLKVIRGILGVGVDYPGKPTSHSVIYKDPSVNGDPLFTTDASSVELPISFTNDLSNGIYKYMFDLIFSTNTSIKVFLYGECGETGYNTTTWYDHWNGSSRGGSTQDDVNGSYFHRGYGTHIYMYFGRVSALWRSPRKFWKVLRDKPDWVL